VADVISVAIVSFFESAEKKLCFRFIVLLACTMKLIMDSNITGTKKGLMVTLCGLPRKQSV